MTTLVYVIAYLGIVFFLIAVAARFVFWSKMPMHLRWELYPVAHEGGGRAAYGGSYFEESDWWKKKREVSLLGELKVMVFPFTLGSTWSQQRPSCCLSGGSLAPCCP
jgi:hypothetical protein